MQILTKNSIDVIVEDLKDYCREYYERVYICEGQKWDLEREVRRKEYEVVDEPKKWCRFFCVPLFHQLPPVTISINMNTIKKKEEKPHL